MNAPTSTPRRNRLAFTWPQAVRFALAALFVIGLPANAHAQDPRTAVNAGTVTVMTDAQGSPDSRAAKMISQLSRRIGDFGRLRVLPIAGNGGLSNLRDLLYLRGLDFAVVNSDVLATPGQSQITRVAQRRLRYVTKLQSQRVLIFAANRHERLSDLQDQTVHVLTSDASAEATADLLLRRLKLRTQLSAIPLAKARMQAEAGSPGAFILLEDQVIGAKALIDALRKRYRLLPIPSVPDVTAVYEPATVSANELRAFHDGQAVPTVSVATILAVFNWRGATERVENVLNFIETAYQAMAQARAAPGDQLFQSVDVNGRVPGWRRYEPASPERISDASVRAALDGTRAQPLPSFAAADQQPPQTVPHKNLASGKPDLIVPPKPTLVDPSNAQGGPGTTQTTTTAKTAAAAAFQTGGPTSARTPTKARTQPLKMLALQQPLLASKRDDKGGLALEILGLALGNQAVTDQSAAGALAPTFMGLEPRALISAIEAGTFDLIGPIEHVDCGQTQGQSHLSAFICDRARLSVPLLQVVIGLFAPAGRNMSLAEPDSLRGARLCVPETRDTTDLDSRLSSLGQSVTVTLIRAPNLLACFGQVQAGNADAVVANELAGRQLLRQLGLNGLFQMAEQPVATRTLHVAVLKDHPRATQLVGTIDQAIKAFRADAAYGEIMRKRLMSLWTAQ